MRAIKPQKYLIQISHKTSSTQGTFTVAFLAYISSRIVNNKLQCSFNIKINFGGISILDPLIEFASEFTYLQAFKNFVLFIMFPCLHFKLKFGSKTTENKSLNCSKTLKTFSTLSNLVCWSFKAARLLSDFMNSTSGRMAKHRAKTMKFSKAINTNTEHYSHDAEKKEKLFIYEGNLAESWRGGKWW